MMRTTLGAAMAAVVMLPEARASRGEEVVVGERASPVVKNGSVESDVEAGVEPAATWS